jgi:hypothetical protein
MTDSDAVVGGATVVFARGVAVTGDVVGWLAGVIVVLAEGEAVAVGVALRGVSVAAGVRVVMGPLVTFGVVVVVPPMGVAVMPLTAVGVDVAVPGGGVCVLPLGPVVVEVREVEVVVGELGPSGAAVVVIVAVGVMAAGVEVNEETGVAVWVVVETAGGGTAGVVVVAVAVAAAVVATLEVVVVTTSPLTHSLLIHTPAPGVGRGARSSSLATPEMHASDAPGAGRGYGKRNDSKVPSDSVSRNVFAELMLLTGPPYVAPHRSGCTSAPLTPDARKVTLVGWAVTDWRA